MNIRYYLAGPMSGIEDFNFPAFHHWAQRLRAEGFEIINPAELNPDHSMPWAECMKRDIAALVTCDGIALMPGWERSRGAKLEHDIAHQLGLRKMFLTEMVPA